MPLEHGKSQKAFTHNIKAEMQAGKPLKQSLAIAYATKRRAQKEHMGHGGEVCKEHGVPGCEICHEADGGYVHEREEKASGYAEAPHEHEKHNEMAMHEDEHEDEKLENHDIVSRIMHKMGHGGMAHKSHHYSHGGKVANDTSPRADFESNQFDDLVKDDDLEFHYDAKNSGDELGNEHEDEDERDIIKKIMKKRHKDRMPHPA